MVLLLPYGWNCRKWDMKMVSEGLNCSNMKNFLYSDIVGGCGKSIPRVVKVVMSLQIAMLTL
jgi:hypothetical protein